VFRPLPEDRLSRLIQVEERVALGADRVRPQLATLLTLGDEVLLLQLQDRTGDCRSVVGVQRREALADLLDLVPLRARTQSRPTADRRCPPGHGTKPPSSVATMAMESVSQMT